MSEAPRGVQQETVAFVEGEMATATVGEGLRSSLLPLKRRPLEFSHEEDEFSNCHQSKRFLSEELMSAHLEHLRLSSEGSAQITPSITPHHHHHHRHHRDSLTPQAVEGILPPYPRQLNIKTVASCPQSLASQLGRKRSFKDQECLLDEDMSEDCEMDTSSIPVRKRSRMDLGGAESNSNFSNCVRYKSDSKVGHLQARSDHQHSDGTLPLVGTDLSSIPEEGEPCQTSTHTDAIDTSSPNADTADNASISEEDVGLPHIPVSLPPSQSVPLTLKDGEVGGKACSIWLAPEIKSIKTHADSPLPLSILKKIGQQPVRGMEIVPWVGGLRTLFRQQQHKKHEEVKASEGGGQDAPATTSDSSTMETS